MASHRRHATPGAETIQPLDLNDFSEEVRSVISKRIEFFSRRQSHEDAIRAAIDALTLLIVESFVEEKITAALAARLAPLLRQCSSEATRKPLGWGGRRAAGPRGREVLRPI
jgi:hypothetical protein